MEDSEKEYYNAIIDEIATNDKKLFKSLIEYIIDIHNLMDFSKYYPIQIIEPNKELESIGNGLPYTQ